MGLHLICVKHTQPLLPQRKITRFFESLLKNIELKVFVRRKSKSQSYDYLLEMVET